MKWNILALLMGLSMVAFSQQSIVWSEDFSNGIPSNWMNEESGGTAVWEYRGPSTTPNITVGTQSSCVLGGGNNPDIIQSPSVANGFVIFDGANWDNPDLPCNTNNLGTGTAPGPHLAMLTTPVVDLTGIMYPALEFNQYYRNFQSVTRVEMSIADGPWSIMYQSALGVGETTEKTLKSRVILGSEASNQSNVRFRFVFDGQYYYWMLDDIAVVNLFENDMRTLSGSYGDFDFFAQEHPTGYEEMEYSKYPVELAPLLKFNVMAINNGWLTQTNVKLRATVENVNTSEILTQQISAEGFNFQPLGVLELRAGSFQMPNTIGSYRVRYEITQDEVDAVDENDLLELYFEITEDVYARDKGDLQSVTLPVSNQEITPFEIGTIYHIPSAGHSAYSISVALGPGTSLPTSVYAKLYRADFSFDLGLTEVGETELTPVLQEQVNDFGEEEFITMNFESPVPLLEGKAYMAAIGSPNGMLNVYTGLDGVADLNTSWVRVFPNDGSAQLLTLSRIPMIRLNLGGEITNVEESSSEKESTSLLVFPNPAKNVINLTSSAPVVSWKIMDTMGRMVKEMSLSQMNNFQISIEDLKIGFYIISVQTSEGMEVTRFLKK